jgi:hypothetical protein
MKKYLMPLVLLVFFAGTSCHHHEKIDIEKEKEAILALITEETNAYHDKDFERFAECYVQNEFNIRILGGEGEFSYTVGWEEVGSGFKEWFENNPDPTPNNEVKKNFKIRVYNDCAWIVFEEEAFNDEGESNGKGIGTNFLEKVDGKWKIAYLSRVHY